MLVNEDLGAVLQGHRVDVGAKPRERSGGLCGAHQPPEASLCHAHASQDDDGQGRHLRNSDHPRHAHPLERARDPVLRRQGDAGLTHSLIVITSELLFWAIIGLAITSWYDRRKLDRISPDILSYVERAIDGAAERGATTKGGHRGSFDVARSDTKARPPREASPGDS
jgi:hypothetical protein